MIRLIRAGTTTQVWEVLNTEERERVAIKILLREHCDNKEEIEYLKHEAAVGKTLDHPNVIKIYDFHKEKEWSFLSMQLYNAKNLKIFLRESYHFVELNMKPIMMKAAESLKHLHENGWVHCDVKPDNFLADEQANLKLIDFSIAEKIKKGFSLFGGGSKTIRGTRSYMAPEQIRKKKLDQRADIYGFGCVLFEMLSKRTPFSATNPDDLLNKHLRAPIPNLEGASGASRRFSDLVARMLQKEPDKRPQTMGDVLLELRSLPIYRAGKGPSRMVKRKEVDDDDE